MQAPKAMSKQEINAMLERRKAAAVTAVSNDYPNEDQSLEMYHRLTKVMSGQPDPGRLALTFLGWLAPALARYQP